MNQSITSRLGALDQLRGLIMVLMTLDHVRDFFFTGAFDIDPTDPETTWPALFITRWITHLCAPGFIFLAGMGIGFSLNKPNLDLKEQTAFLLKRGFWLLLLEVSVINFAWTFNPAFDRLYLGVIWAIGWSFVFMAGLIRLPVRWVLIFGLLTVFGHNLTNGFDVEQVGTLPQGLWGWIHHPFGYDWAPERGFYIIYPFWPWLGLMCLGYAMARLLQHKWRSNEILPWLAGLSAGAIVGFIAVRSTNLYGDAQLWTFVERGGIYTFLSFMNVTKYPPSLLYILATMGVLLSVLWFFQRIKRPIEVLSAYGRVPMFFYLIHLYIIHGLAELNKAWMGNVNPQWADGYGLPGTYVMWLVVLIVTYPMVIWFANYKAKHSHWILKYL